MDTLIVSLVVLTACAFIGRKIFLSVKSARSAKAGCSDCGCGSSASSASDWSKS